MFVSTATQARFPVSRTPVSRPVDNAFSELMFAGNNKKKAKKDKVATQTPEKPVEPTQETTSANSQAVALATPLTEDTWEKQEAQEQPAEAKDLAQSGQLAEKATDTDAVPETAQADAVVDIKRSKSPVQPDEASKDKQVASQSHPNSPKALAQDKKDLTEALDSEDSDPAEVINDFSDSGEEIEELTKEEEKQAAKEHLERKRRRHAEKMETAARIYEGVENTLKSSTRRLTGGVSDIVNTLQDTAISAATVAVKKAATTLTATTAKLESMDYKKK